MRSLTTRTDTHGNPISGPQDAVDRYDDAVGHLLAYHEQLVDAATSLATDEPDFPMGQILGAYLALATSDARDVPGAMEVAAHLDTLTLNDREAAHRAAIGTWLAGDWHGAARRLDGLLIRWPTDLLGLVAGHLLDFYLGDSTNLRDRIGRSLPAFDPAHPNHGYVRGMYAFGLEESGNYQLAEQHGLAAVGANPDDVWATHAVTHVYEMQGRIDEGIRFLRGNEANWGSGNLFTVHNWWHLGLYLLEAERSDQALAIYDRHIHNDRSAGVPLEMLDAERAPVASAARRHRSGRPLRPAGRRVGNPHLGRAVVRVQRPPRRHGAGGSGPAGRSQSGDRPAGRLRRDRGTVVQHAHDRRGGPARLPVGLGIHRGSPLRRGRGAPADPDDPRPLRGLARPARRAPADTGRRRPPCRPARPGPCAAQRADRRTRDQRLVVAPASPGLPGGWRQPRC